MSEELKPCPFCGKHLAVTARRHNPHARCRTENCKGSQLPLLNLDQPEDIERWNCRAQPAEVEGVEVVAFQVRRTACGTTSNLYTEKLPFVPGEGVTQHSEPTALIRLSDHLAALSALSAERDSLLHSQQVLMQSRNAHRDERDRLRAELQALRDLVGQCVEHLNLGRQNSIASGSILHRSMAAAVEDK